MLDDNRAIAEDEEAVCGATPAAPLVVYPALDDLPIPLDARADDRWPAQLIELADFVGPYHALVLADQFGGQQIRVPLDVSRSPFLDVLPRDVAKTIADAFGGCEIEMPVSRAAINFAKRQPLIAAVRARMITVRQAAIILGTARTYVSYLINRSDEGKGYEPIVLPEPKRLASLRAAAEIAAGLLAEAGASESEIASAKAGIVGLYFRRDRADPEQSEPNREEQGNEQ